MDWWVWLTVVVAGSLVIAAFWVAETMERHDRPETAPTDAIPPVLEF